MVRKRAKKASILFFARVKKICYHICIQTKIQIKTHFMNKELDILANLEITEDISQNTTHNFAESETIEDIFEHSQDSFFTLENTVDLEEKTPIQTTTSEKIEEAPTHIQEATQEIISTQNTQKGSLFSGIVFLVKYMCTSFLIF